MNTQGALICYLYGKNICLKKSLIVFAQSHFRRPYPHTRTRPAGYGAPIKVRTSTTQQ